MSSHPPFKGILSSAWRSFLGFHGALWYGSGAAILEDAKQQAQKLGVVVLTANVGDYDVLLQLIPTGRVLFYRSR